MIKAIVFDCFGVLASDGWLPYKAKYFGGDPALAEQATELNRAVDAGVITFDEFMAGVAALAGLSEEAAREQVENNIPDERVFELIKKLKPEYRIGMLSNAGADWLHDIFTSEQVDMFDAVALSFEMGHIKPQPEAYQSIIERLGVLPAECLFVDDQPKYVEGAAQVGMTAVLYTSAEQLERDLTQLLADS